MGYQDRDYARAGRNPSAPRGVGRLRLLSFNTWLIAINIAVFVLNNVLMQGVQWRIGAGTAYYPGVTAEQRARAQFDRPSPTPMSDGTWRWWLIDPQTVQPGPFGVPLPTPIGFERFRLQPVIEGFGHFSTAKFWSEGQLWRLVTFQFLHFDLWHLLFNMLGLWFVGGLVEQYLGARRYAIFYLLCGVCGALAYMFLNLLGHLAVKVGTAGPAHVPFLLFDDVYTPLIGASAGVFGVLMAAAFIAPTAIVDVMLVIPMKLRTAVYLFLALAVFNLYRSGHNAGGDAAHVGGAIAGAFLIRRPYLLRDFATGFGLFGAGKAGPRAAPPARHGSIDRIFDKVRTHGAESLTEGERATLRRMVEAEGGR